MSNSTESRNLLTKTIHRIPARQKQHGHPQQAQAEAVESLGFAGLFRKCPVEFIRLVERGVNAPTMNVSR